MKITRRPLVAVALFLASLASLASAPAAQAGAPKRPASVTTDYPEVVVLFSEVNFGDGGPGGAGRCTGTWIHPRLLLTAAHCVANFYSMKMNGVVYPSTDGNGNIVPDKHAKPTEVWLQGRQTVFGYKKLHPTRVHVSPNAVPVNHGDLTLDYVEQDLAILEYATESPHTRRVTRAVPEIGDEVVMVGYGRHWGSEVLKHQGRNRLTMVELDMTVSNGASGACREPGKHIRDWAICGGDSGGPLIHAQTGEVLGVASASVTLRNPTTGEYTGRKLSVHTDLSSPAAVEFIRRVRAEAGVD